MNNIERIQVDIPDCKGCALKYRGCRIKLRDDILRTSGNPNWCVDDTISPIKYYIFLESE